jgi:hypothetical protein
MKSRIKLGIVANSSAFRAAGMPAARCRQPSDHERKPQTNTFHQNWQGASGRGISNTVNKGGARPKSLKAQHFDADK